MQTQASPQQAIATQKEAGGKPPAIRLTGIEKRFGPVHANKNVSMEVPQGSIHGIIGENGAGKSTLMSILYGYYRADAGLIEVKGRPVVMNSPQDALKHGIGMVHQHFMLVDNFTVLENILLGAEGGFLLKGGMAQARAKLERLQKEYHLEVDLDALIEDIGVGQQQRVEILKALYRDADILILDEPTGVLTPQEADHLFRILRTLREEGKTVILITHKLREIMDVTDNVTVMRQGAVVANVRTKDATRELLAELMVGRKVLLRVEKGPAHPGDEVLAVKGLEVMDSRGCMMVKGISFSVRAGEIVGIAGVSGNGQSELLQALAGMRMPLHGEILWKGQPVDALLPTRDPRSIRRLGVGHVPEDRQRMGLITGFVANESAILGYHDDPRYNKGLLMNRKAIIEGAKEKMQEYDVRPGDPFLRTAAFSGGNQQKIVLAREMERMPDLLLVGQPTRGVDIGAIEFIHKRLVELRDAGKAILLVSVELDEIMSLADRILVMFDGHIVGEVAPAEADEKTLGLMMAGIAQPGKE